MKRVLLCLAVCAAVLVPLPAGAATTIQPGDYMGSSVGGCTLGFVADGGSSTYFMTAAHCVDKVGEDIELLDGTVFGDVAVIGDPDGTATDWALVEVRPAFVSQVRAAVRGVGNPTGVAAPNHTSMLDVVRFSGHGVPWFIDPLTRENRVGLLGYHDAQIYDAVGLDTWGDSGGPIVHQRTGRALGLVSRLCIGVCTSEGPTVQGILAKAAARGFAVSLRTQ